MTALRRIVPVVLALALGGCARQTGDFGRAEPDVIHDTLMPFAGDLTAKYVRKEQVSRYNDTDAEVRLRDRAWALVMPPHTGDWIGETAIELQRTRLLPDMDSRFTPKAYYAFLRRETFRSSDVRWARLIADMRTDRSLIEPFWDEARTVRADDTLRMQAFDARTNADARELQNAYARIDENARVVDWVWRSLRYRLAAYRNAIERMVVETPSRRRIEADLTLRDLELAVAAAESGPNGPPAGGMTGLRPSRYTDARLVKETVPQK